MTTTSNSRPAEFECRCDMLGTDAKGQQGGEALSTPLVENSEDSVLKTFKFTFCEGFPVGGGNTQVAGMFTHLYIEPTPSFIFGSPIFKPLQRTSANASYPQSKRG
jgi:hypothetical protein